MMNFSFAAKSFGSTPILQAVSFSLEDGKVTILLGSSGIGKTTLLRMIAGLLSDDSGHVHRNDGIGMVFQEPRLMPWLSARENVELAGPENGWLSQMGLEGSEHLYPRQLSLGMARRVAIARALAINPLLLILDEPFASLDEETAAGVRTTLSRLFRTRSITTLLVTHQAKDVSAFDARKLKLGGRPAAVTAE